jgi:GDP-4-dehydro-6-deoxy-D-mannose reductase
MQVYVTGASGFVGRKLLPRLEAAGMAAVGVDTDVDVTNADAVESSLRRHRPDAIIHLAAMSSVAQSAVEPERCYQVNFGGTRTILRSAEKVCPEARILLVGSTDQYAATNSEKSPAPAAFPETTPLEPRSPYARTKTASEMLGQEAALAGQDVVRIRASNHTGRGQPDHFVVSSFARQVAAIHAGRQAPLMRVGNLDSVRDFLHVDDVLDAYVTLLDRSIPPDVYNVASGNAVPIRDILDRLIRIAQIDPAVEVDPDRWRPTDWCVADASKLRSISNWAPKISLDALLEELFEDWLSQDEVA